MVFGIPTGAIVAIIAIIAIIFLGEPFGRGATGLGAGLGSLGSGIQRFISGTFSPQIRPTFLPTVGFNVESNIGGGIEYIRNTLFGSPVLGGSQENETDKVITPATRETGDYGTAYGPPSSPYFGLG